jgi:D-arabinose 1-dehydrogenase-like Zn-dependent alcohol dehydrogenase
MKAVRLTAVGAPLQEQGIDLPRVARNDVLIRVRAAGICHSDTHYRAGVSPVARLPLSLGHEVAGVVEDVGPGVTHFKTGDRVCVHYLVTCGECEFCSSGHEQFCPSAEMIGKHRDGGYAEFIAVPERSVFRLPDEIPFQQGAVMMCSSATSLHALRKARLKAGETVAVFGVGGLGISAIQLATALGAAKVFAIDINSHKLAFAERFGAILLDASAGDPLTQLRELTDSRGVDVALELVGLAVTMTQAVQSLAILGRAALVGLTQERFEVAPYLELLNKEAEIIGVSDHLASDIPVLLDFVREQKLNLSRDLIRTVPLESDAINDALDGLANFGDDVRTVIVV